MQLASRGKVAGVFTDRECLHQIGRLCGQMLLLLDVVPHIAELLLQHAHRLKVRRMVEGIAPEKQELRVGKRTDQFPHWPVPSVPILKKSISSL